jgi:hypothetical protein
LTKKATQQLPPSLEGSPSLDLRQSYRRSISPLAIGVVAVVVTLLLGVIPGPGPFDPPKAPPTILAAIWAWLEANRNSIAPLSQLATAVGVGVAAVTFFRTQRMNRADWLFKALKEVRDMMKDVHKKEDYSDEKLIGIINFYAALYFYFHYRLVSYREWSIFEKDLSQFIHHFYQLRDWLNPQITRPRGFPRIENYDGDFIAYLRELQSRPA